MGCNTVNSVSSQTMHMWKGASLLCYKRAKSMTFYDSVKTDAPSGGSSSTMDICSSGEVYQVSTLPGVACPVTGLSNATVGSGQTSLSFSDSSQSTLNFINRTGYPIAGFKLTEYQFCDFLDASNISTNK